MRTRSKGTVNQRLFLVKEKDVKPCTALADRKWAVDSDRVVRYAVAHSGLPAGSGGSSPLYPLRLVRFQLNSRGLERRGVPGRMGTDLCSETVDGTELTYGRRPDSRTRLICMER